VKHVPVVLCAALALCGPAGAGPPAPVPILEYHVIGDPPAGTPFPGLYTSVADFEAQLGWLAAHGYTAVTLDRVHRYWTRGAALPQKPVVLTFDDGYPEDWQVVMPLLRERRWPGNLNLKIGNLVPQRVRKLIAAGWEIDAHTFTHTDLTRASPSLLRHDVAGSRRWIQNVFKQPANFFCYPAGRYDDTVIAAVRRAGYLGAETEVAGKASPADGMFTLPRFEMLRGDGVAGLAANLGR